MVHAMLFTTFNVLYDSTVCSIEYMYTCMDYYQGGRCISDALDLYAHDTGICHRMIIRFSRTLIP